MISLLTVFWLIIFFFGVIGFMRGWTKEIIAMAGLILSLFAIHQFGARLVTLWQGAMVEAGPNDNIILVAMKQQFYVLSIFHLILAFFSYQGAPLANQVTGGRLGVRMREGLQERMLGAVFGCINGYLVIGALWSFLEYQITVNGYNRLDAALDYAFSPLVIRTFDPSIQTLELVLTHLPLPFLAPYLAVAIVLLFVFVIVVII